MKTWQATKLYGRLLLRLGRDALSRDRRRFSRQATQCPSFAYAISLAQEIKPGATFENKLFNLAAAGRKINQHVVRPNEIFSFWHAVGNPHQQFKKGRTIRNGRLLEEGGGGLCQASGILYLLSLTAGLEIIERHNHSVDIYTEETRFAPLGSDATVVYGYKDLRIRNPYPFPIQFELAITGHVLQAHLRSAAPVREDTIQFRVRHLPGSKIVETLSSAARVLSVSTYIGLTQLVALHGSPHPLAPSPKRRGGTSSSPKKLVSSS